MKWKTKTVTYFKKEVSNEAIIEEFNRKGYVIKNIVPQEAVTVIFEAVYLPVSPGERRKFQKTLL